MCRHGVSSASAVAPFHRKAAWDECGQQRPGPVHRRIELNIESASELLKSRSHRRNSDAGRSRPGAASQWKTAPVVADPEPEMTIRRIDDDVDLGCLCVAKHIRKRFLSDAQQGVLAAAGQSIHISQDPGAHSQRCPRCKPFSVALDGGFQPFSSQVLRMQQIGERPDLLQGLVDRGVDVVAEPLGINRIGEAGPDPHEPKAGGDQMLTG